MKERVAERIRQLRFERKFSQENMADELGLSISAYSNIERGVSEISISRLMEIAQILGVSASDIIIYAENGSLAEDPRQAYVDMMGKRVEILEVRIQQIEQELRKAQSEINRAANPVNKKR